MKNLFSFATKELSQDAFLRWLFENYEDEDIKPIVRALLKEFCSLEDDEIITSDIKTWAQWCYIDISIHIDTNKRKIALFIEDKAFSHEHDQLEDYNTHIKNYYINGKDKNKRTIYKVFYKTSLLSDEDKVATQKADWKAYDIEKISSLYAPFVDCKNTIVQQYIEYLNSLYIATNYTVKPKGNDCWVDWLRWDAYFRNVILPRFNENFPASRVYSKGRYPYVALCIKKKEGYPYLEIRSRDCVGKDGENPIKVKILCYGVKDFSPQEEVVKKIQNDCSDIFECKYVMHKNGHEPKQIGFHTATGIDTDEKFIAEIEKCISSYIEIVGLWESYSKNS